jgi:carnitine O-acetyltransferase
MYIHFFSSLLFLIEFLHFEEFGKLGIVQHRMSPDGFVQMCFQLAYHRMTGTIGSTYESANTKRFRHGRTETVRSVSEESALLCTQWQCSEPARRVYLFRGAVQAHGKRMRECKEGMGVDRHLYVLAWLAKQREQREAGYRIPALFEDVALRRLSASVLSTSNCGGPAVALFGFGAVVPNGLGVGYIIEPNELRITVSSFSAAANRFCDHLRAALTDVMNTLRECAPAHQQSRRLSAKL